MNLKDIFKKRPIDPDTCLILLGHFFMLLLVYLSVYFYAERVLYYDSAYQCFQLINSESYNIEAGRWSTILVQTFPLIAIKLGLPLKTVLITYSLSYVLIGYIVFIINAHLLKNTVASTAVLFLYTVCIQDSFYYCVTELPVGMLFTTTFYAWLFYPEKTQKQIHPVIYVGVATILLLICFFFHPMTFFSIVFIIGVYLLHTKKYKNPRIIVLLLITFILYASKILFTSSASYEGNLFGQLNSTPELISQLLSLDSTKFFILRLFSLYLIVTLLLFAITAYYIVKKNWLLLGWFALNTGGFLLICFITFNKGDSHIAMEKYFMPLSFLVAIPFLQDIMSTKKIQLVALLFCLFIFCRGINKIYLAKNYFEHHLEYVDTLIHLAHSQSTKKLLVFKDDIDQNYTTWACGTETLLRSALNTKQEQTTVYLTDKNEPDQINTKDSVLFLCVPFYRNWNQNDLNKKYFNLPLQPYLVNQKNASGL
ncbi:hypothetical protein [Cytophaga aurantiaca]|uniref:hypothetical protein n=1 Tax=Cytophaga aurantiaca TaxID=29530 RepID=UPI00036DAB56|nr:hypothetical protein [Cytophaga aurantiaca]